MPTDPSPSSGTVSARRLVSVVVPAFNEEDNIEAVHAAVAGVFAELPGYRLELILVDDGSSDGSMEGIRALAARCPEVFFLELSRNFGHQQALGAGLRYARGEAVISLDADLQHPPHLIPGMIRCWENGAEVVHTVREDDQDLPALKRATSRGFYWMLNLLSDQGLEPGTADFRLLDRKVVDVLNSLRERNPFLRGLAAWVGFRQEFLHYRPDPRHAGLSKYTVRKMMRLALEGITSFSVKPLYFAVYAGLIFAGLSLLFVPYVLVSVALGRAVSGWASILMAIAFFGGLQLIVLGIIGIYLGKLFMQAKMRPSFIIRSTNLPDPPP